MSQAKTTSFSLRLMFFLNSILGFALILSYLSTHVSPNSIPYLSFFGLAYPLLLIGLILFVVFWFLFKKKYLLFNAVIFFLGWNHFTDFFVFSSAKQTLSKDKSVHLMSYNLRIFNYYDVKNRQADQRGIYQFLSKTPADIYCFQEFYENNEANYRTKDTLKSKLKTPYISTHFTSDLSGKQHFGLATFSKFPIIQQGVLRFENDDNNACLFTDIKFPHDTIRVYNAHLGSIRFQDNDYAFFGDDDVKKNLQREEVEQQIVVRLKLAFEKRAIQVEEVMKHISKSEHPVVLAGDFNDTPVSYCYRHISEVLVDAFVESGSGIGTTYIGKIPSNRIDYIFHSKELQSADFITHQVEFSDHRPISCSLSN